MWVVSSGCRLQGVDGVQGTQGSPRQVSQEKGVVQGYCRVPELDPVMQNMAGLHELEEKAKALRQAAQFGEGDLLSVLEALTREVQSRDTAEKGQWLTFGACCGETGPEISQETKELPEITRYLNEALGHKFPKGQKWTTIRFWVQEPEGLRYEEGCDPRYPKTYVCVGDYRHRGVWTQETLPAREMGIHPEPSILLSSLR